VPAKQEILMLWMIILILTLVYVYERTIGEDKRREHAEKMAELGYEQDDLGHWVKYDE